MPRSTVSSTPAAAMNNKQIHESLVNQANFLGAVDGKGTHKTSDDGVAITYQAEGLAYAGGIGSNFAGKGVANSGSLDDTLDLWVFGQTNQLASNTSAGKFGQLMDEAGNAISAKVYLAADGMYHLQISAVPEPETYAMLLAGLGLIGAAARRRRV